MGTHASNNVILSLLALTFFLSVAFLYIFGLGGTGLFDIYEARTAQISAEAATTNAAGTSPELMGAPYLKTPPLIHYAQSLSYQIFGVTPFAARLPSALAAFIMVFVLYNSLWLLTGARRFSLLAAGVFALSPGVVLAARLATPTALFMLLTLAATFMLIGNIYHNERSYLRLFVAGLVLGLAFLAGGVFAFVFAFFVAFLLAALKDHRGYNFASLAPFSVLIASFLAVFPWAIAVLKTKGLEGLKAYVMAFSGIDALTFDFSYGTWWHVLAVAGLLTLPWSLFPLPALLPNIRRLSALRGYDPRTGLPALALVWLLLGGLLAVLAGVSGLMWSVWLAVPVAILVADFFDRLPEASLSWLWAAVIFAGVLGISALFFWLPQMAEILSGDGTFKGLSGLLDSAGLTGYLSSPFWQAVLQVKTDWGVTLIMAGGTFLVALVGGVYLMRHGALEGAAFVFVGVWFVLFMGTQSMAGNVYDHLQEPLKWMSVKIKKEHQLALEVRPDVKEPVKVVLYGIQRPSVAFSSGISYRLADSARKAFSGVRPLFVITDVRHISALEEHIPAGTGYECIGGYCLVELYK